MGVYSGLLEGKQFIPDRTPDWRMECRETLEIVMSVRNVERRLSTRKRVRVPQARTATQRFAVGSK